MAGAKGFFLVFVFLTGFIGSISRFDLFRLSDSRQFNLHYMPKTHSHVKEQIVFRLAS